MGNDLFIWRTGYINPCFSAKVRGKTAAHALLRFGLKRREFASVLHDIDMGREVQVAGYTIHLNGGVPKP